MKTFLIVSFFAIIPLGLVVCITIMKYLDRPLGQSHEGRSEGCWLLKIEGEDLYVVRGINNKKNISRGPVAHWEYLFDHHNHKIDRGRIRVFYKNGGVACYNLPSGMEISYMSACQYEEMVRRRRLGLH